MSTSATADTRAAYETLVADLAAGCERGALDCLEVTRAAGRTLADLARDVDAAAAGVPPDDTGGTGVPRARG